MREFRKAWLWSLITSVNMSLRYMVLTWSSKIKAYNILVYMARLIVKNGH